MLIRLRNVKSNLHLTKIQKEMKKRNNKFTWKDGDKTYSVSICDRNSTPSPVGADKLKFNLIDNDNLKKTVEALDLNVMGLEETNILLKDDNVRYAEQLAQKDDELCQLRNELEAAKFDKGFYKYAFLGLVIGVLITLIS